MNPDARPAKPPPGKCPNDSDGSRESCPMQCKYNFFESEDLTIHTYELKCLDCGWRDTVGYRSDEDDENEVDENEDDEDEGEGGNENASKTRSKTEDADDIDPAQCPFCNNCDLTPGKNPCQAN